jgi:hypothetical protein
MPFEGVLGIPYNYLVYKYLLITKAICHGVTLDVLLQSNQLSALRSKSRRLARSKTRGTAVLLGNATLNQWDCLSSGADNF